MQRHHIDLAKRVRDAGGIPMEFPVHPIQEAGKRRTVSLDRNLAYLGLVEVLHGYPLDGVVLTTGCDKTTPACLMAAATVNIPSIVLSGGPKQICCALTEPQFFLGFEESPSLELLHDFGPYG